MKKLAILCKICEPGRVWKFNVNWVKNIITGQLRPEVITSNVTNNIHPVLVNLFSNDLFLCTKEREDSLKSLITQNNLKTN